MNEHKVPCAPVVPRSALQILENSPHKLSLGCGTLDTVVNGGLNTGMLYDLCGEGGAGKTQLLLQLALHVQLPRELGGLGGSAVWINSHGEFPLTRLQELQAALKRRFAKLASSPNSNQRKRNLTHRLEDIEQIEEWIQSHDFLDNILIRKCSNLPELTEVLLPKALMPLVQLRAALASSAAKARAAARTTPAATSARKATEATESEVALMGKKRAYGDGPGNENLESPRPTNQNTSPLSQNENQRTNTPATSESGTEKSPKAPPSGAEPFTSPRYRALRPPLPNPPVRLLVIDSIASICDNTMRQASEASSATTGDSDASSEAESASPITTIQRAEYLAKLASDLKRMAHMYGMVIVTTNNVSDVFETELLTPKLKQLRAASHVASSRIGPWSGWVATQLAGPCSALRWCKFPFDIEREPALGIGWGKNTGRLTTTLHKAVALAKQEVEHAIDETEGVGADAEKPRPTRVEPFDPPRVNHLEELETQFLKPKLGLAWTMLVSARMFITRCRSGSRGSTSEALRYSTLEADSYETDEENPNIRPHVRRKTIDGGVVSPQQLLSSPSASSQNQESLGQTMCLRLKSASGVRHDSNFIDPYIRALTLQFAPDFQPGVIKFQITPEGVFGCPGTYCPKTEEI